MSLPLPSFAEQDFARTPDTAPPHSRHSYTHRRWSAGCRPLAMIWNYLIQIIHVLLCLILQCPMSCLIWADWRQSTPRGHRDLQRLWTGIRRSLKLLSFLRICRLFLAGSRHSTPGCHRYLRRLWTGCLYSHQCPTTHLWMIQICYRVQTSVHHLTLRGHT